MSTSIRIATWNLENLDDTPGGKPTLAERIAVMRPALVRLRADVLVLQEVNGQEAPGRPRQLDALTELLRGTRYAEFGVRFTKTAAGEAYDVRNLAIVSRFEFQDVLQRDEKGLHPFYKKVTAAPPEPEARRVDWERPIFYAKLKVTDARSLHVLNLHLKSRLPSDVAGQKKDQYTWRTASGWAEGYFISSMKRVGQALDARMLVDDLFDSDPGAWIAVCGDFNAESHEVPVTAIRGPVEETGNPAHAPRVLIPCENTIPESSRHSLFHLGKGLMLDHVLVSRPLAAFYRGAEIHNEVLPDESGAFRTDPQFPESDHAPVIAEFALP